MVMIHYYDYYQYPAWRAPSECSLGCARWANLYEDGNIVCIVLFFLLL